MSAQPYGYDITALTDITSSRRYNSKPMVFDIDIDEPPASLVLLINPSNLEIKFQPRVAEQRIRWTGLTSAYVFQVHRDELDILTATGKSAMFMSDKGITRKDRTDTLAYENIETLVAIYRNNGMNLNKKPGSTINPCAIDSVGRVVITYNNFMYRGHFTSFTFTENDGNPFNVDFSFEFKVTKTFDVSQTTGNSF